MKRIIFYRMARQVYREIGEEYQDDNFGTMICLFFALLSFIVVETITLPIILTIFLIKKFAK